MGETQFNIVSDHSLAGRGHLFHKSAALQYVIRFRAMLITSDSFITARKKQSYVLLRLEQTAGGSHAARGGKNKRGKTETQHFVNVSERTQICLKLTNSILEIRWSD